MAESRSRAAAEFKRMILWIGLAGVLMVAGALFYISLYEPLRLHMVIATVLGVFFSVLLGAGLFAGAAGALAYAMHCPELEVPFLGAWYVAGMLIPTALGALLGRRLLHW